MSWISEIEEDILKEFFNMGLGMAADALSRMVDQEVILSLPSLAVVNQQEAQGLVDGCPEETMVAIRLRFHGELEGTALLVFPGAKSLELVRILLHEEVALERLGELEQETLLDVGNVLLNAFLASFTQMLRLDFQFEAAEFLRAPCGSLLEFSAHFGNAAVGREVQQAIFLIMNFKTVEEEIARAALKGYVALLFSPHSLEVLKGELERILQEMG